MNTEQNDMVIDTSPAADTFALQHTRMTLDAGWLGRAFGTGATAPVAIAGFVCTVLIAAGVVLLFVKAEMTAEAYWSRILPTVTLVLGYLFGRKS
jgi:hypothetical protein